MGRRRAAAEKAKSSRNDCHRRSVAALQAANVPFLIGGAYVVEAFAGVSRRTKDFDLYIRPRHVRAAMDALAGAGYKAEMTFPHWLAKAARGRDCVDLIFRAGNGLCEVDDSWFERAHDDQSLGLHMKFCAPEEMIWMKAFIMERERFDGADIAHILVSCADKLDWQHLIQRFGPDFRVLLSHLVLFGYIYPTEQDRIPKTGMEDVIARLRKAAPAGGQERLGRGTLLLRKAYMVDVHEWGLLDARLERRVHMDSEDIAHWTKAIAKAQQARQARGV